MQIKADTPQQYVEYLPEDRKPVIQRLREVITTHIPDGFEETMSYGMIGYVVPHSLYAPGYHCDPKLPLPFMNIASQKNYVAVYHMGIYTDQQLMEWFTDTYKTQYGTKLDMGKSCMRFKKLEQIPFDLIGELASKITPQKWIEIYESQLKK